MLYVNVFGGKARPLRLAGALLLAASGASACSPGPKVDVSDAGELALVPWDSVVGMARGTEVTWRMWRGDPAVNAYVDGWVASTLAERFDIRLVAVEGRGAELVNQFVVEREARAKGGADLVWINGETFHNLMAEESLQFIDKNKDRPFFLYVAHSMPHVPLFVSNKYKGKSTQGMYGDVISEIDWSAGQILETIKRNGLDDN